MVVSSGGQAGQRNPGGGGMSADIVEKLQEKATVLTHESPGRFRSDEICPN